MRGLLEGCREATGSDARFTWVGEQFLLEKGVEPWGELPLWIPESDEKHRYFLAQNCDKAARAGLTFRPLAETARDTLAWQQSGSPGFVQEGLTAHERTLTSEREAELLNEWHETSQNHPR
jgi:2'-hydroxyisoflavone reductase